MKSALRLTVLVVAFCASLPALAFQQETHRRIAIDAVTFMKNNPDKTNFTKLAAGLARASYTVEQFTTAMGKAFMTSMILPILTCAEQPPAVANWHRSGVRPRASLNTLPTGHFQNHTAGPDVHGNPFGGYNYAKLTVAGDIDNLAAAWLVGDYLDDGAGGLKGWFGDSSKYNAYGITEAHYRHGGNSTVNQYADFEKAPFQPIDNLAQYWFQQFLAKPSLQSLGFAMHSTDLLQPHHTWTTSAKNHSGWEQWVNDYYYSQNLNDVSLVNTALADFSPLAATATDIRPFNNGQSRRLRP